VTRKAMRVSVLSFAVVGTLVLCFLNLVTAYSLPKYRPVLRPQAKLSTRLQQSHEHSHPFVNDLLRQMNYKGAVDSSRGGSRVHDLFNPDFEAIRFEKRTHPTHTR
jgi:hypothetical protein